MNNSTNASSIFDLDIADLIDVSSIVTLSLSFLFDVVAISMIAKSQSKLAKAEFFILMACQAFSFVYKIFTSFLCLAIFLQIFLLGSTTCALVYPNILLCSTGFNLVLLYLSLYHFACIKRARLYTWLFRLTHSHVNFGVYLFVVFTLLALLFSNLFIFLHQEILTEKAHKCHVNYTNKVFICAILFCNFPLFLVLIVYSSSIPIILMKMSKISTRKETKRLKKKFRISLQFLSFSLVPFAAFLFRFSLFLLAFMCPSCKLETYNLVQFFIIATFMIQPVALVNTHSILRKQLWILLFEVFKRIKQFFSLSI
jgi:hypothetical protein